MADIFNAYYAMEAGTPTVDEAAAESLAQPETAADAAEAPADGTADPAAGETEDAGQNDAAAAPAEAAATAGAGRVTMMRGFRWKLEKLPKKSALLSENLL